MLASPGAVWAVAPAYPGRTEDCTGGFVRISIMISRETREILAVRATGYRTGDSPQFEGLPNDSLESPEIDPGERRRRAETART